MAGPRNPRQILCRFKRLAAPTGRQVKAATLRWASKFKSGGRVAGDTRLWAHFAAQRRQLGREPGPLALVSSASLVHAAASIAQGSKGPSASRRQWSACVLYVSASSSKRSASIWFMTEVSQRQPPPAFRSWEQPGEGLTDVFGVMMVEIVVVPVMMTTTHASQPDQQACAIAWRPRCKFPWPPDPARFRPWLRLLWPCDDIPLLSISCRPAR